MRILIYGAALAEKVVDFLLQPSVLHITDSLSIDSSHYADIPANSSR